MAKPEGLVSVVSQLRVERTSLVNQLRQVVAALSVLGRLNGGHSGAKARRTMSPSARKKIAAAQKARWARVKGRRNLVPIARGKKSKRSISAAGRRKIAAAQRARWAKVRAKQEEKAA